MSLDQFTEPPRSQGDVCAAITKAIVSVVSGSTGRGPTKVRTFINDDLVTVLLVDLLTKVERTLVAHGQEAAVLNTRRALQQSMRSQYVAMVERETGRTVSAFLSSNHVDPDVEIESFLLEASM